jgi:hypothetical protein
MTMEKEVRFGQLQLNNMGSKLSVNIFSMTYKSLADPWPSAKGLKR